MKTPTRYQVEQLTLNFDALDRPQFSICPNCSSDIISLADGCRICGWSENQSSIDECSSKTTPPSKNCSRKTRRQKGEGSGAIFYRTVTRNGREYQEAYYHWRDNGKQKSKYIPLKLLDEVKQAESRKLPVSDILVLLGCIEKCSRKKSDICEAVSFRTSIISTDDKVIDTWDKCSRKKIHPSKKRREKGRGTAYIECKPITKNRKEYKQYWFHWQVWRDGETAIKKSRYIPKRLVSKVEKMNDEKAAVREILEVLGVKE